MSQPGQERLELSYTRGSGGDVEQVKQTVHLCFTEPHFGGKRWFMVCPYRGLRVGKLYLPPGAHYFGCRHCHDLTAATMALSDMPTAFASPA